METNKMMSEAELQILLTKYLSKYFRVENEVWSINYKKRIDIVMIHNSDIQKEYPL